MEKPRINTQLVYATVANMLPQEGRDFTIDAAYGPDNRARVVLTPLNAMGRAWLPFLHDSLVEPLNKDGVDTVEGGAVAAEVVTVNSIRVQAEKDAEEALKRKIQAAEALAQSKQKEAGAARQAQISRDGKDARPDSAVMAASEAANNATREVMRLKRVSEKIAGIRDTVNKAAVSAAIDDKKHGRTWEIDMDAPLTSLFDRQDADVKMRDKENLIQEIASRMVAVDDIEKDAVNIAKQYIMQKGA